VVVVVPHSTEYWLTDATGVVRGTRLRAEFDDDAVAALKQRILRGEAGQLEGMISVVRDDGETIDSWDGPDQVGR
jgi:hypothetical protein